MGTIDEKTKADAEMLIKLNEYLKEINEFKKYFDEEYKVPFEGGCDEGLMAVIRRKEGTNEYQFVIEGLGGSGTEQTKLLSEKWSLLFFA